MRTQLPQALNPAPSPTARTAPQSSHHPQRDFTDPHFFTSLAPFLSTGAGGFDGQSPGHKPTAWLQRGAGRGKTLSCLLRGRALLPSSRPRKA